MFCRLSFFLPSFLPQTYSTMSLWENNILISKYLKGIKHISTLSKTRVQLLSKLFYFIDLPDENKQIPKIN